MTDEPNVDFEGEEPPDPPDFEGEEPGGPDFGNGDDEPAPEGPPPGAAAPADRFPVIGDYDHEEKLLGQLLLAGADGLDTASRVVAKVRATGLERAHFEKVETNGTTYAAALQLVDRGEPCEQLLVRDELQRRGDLARAGGEMRLRELAAAATAYANAAHHAEAILNGWRRREQVSALQAALQAAQNGGLEANENVRERLRIVVTEAVRPAGQHGGGRFNVQSWHDFERSAGTAVPCLVDGLWPEGALTFIAGPPKKGKTWLGLAAGVGVATGRGFLNRLVSTPRNVLYVALEGHKAALRARVGALARGLDVDPDGDELVRRLFFSYRPRGIDLADANWANALRHEVSALGVELVLLDVLRRAAQLDENSARDFARLLANLEPLLADGVSLAPLHHYGKLTELSKEREPGERMTGSGAMFGAMDVGIFITGSEHGARKLRLEFDGRDLAMPDPLGVELIGDGSGDNGSFQYQDRCELIVTAGAPARSELKAPPSEIAAFVIALGGQARPGEILDHFKIAESTLRDRRADLQTFGIHYVQQGKSSVYVTLPDPAIHPVPATPRPSRGNASRGANPHGSDDLPRDPADPAIQTPRGGESGDLQGDLLPRDPALPTGATPAPRGSAPETPDGDLEWR